MATIKEITDLLFEEVRANTTYTIYEKPDGTLTYTTGSSYFADDEHEFVMTFITMDIDGFENYSELFDTINYQFENNQE